MATTGQTLNDRFNAVRYAIAGQGLARTVCKATTEEVLGPKKKHIEYLLACTNEPNVSIPQLANLLIERTQHTSWAVVFKSLITIHHLISYGDERFTQYLATSNHSFELADFMDRTTPQGYNMSTFVRRYAKYINDKSISYRTLAIDLCKIRSGNDNTLRTMNMDNLSKTLPIVQAQFDALLEFAAESKDLNNGVIMSAFRLLYKDLVKLYVAYQEAIINLLERYFKLSRKKTREALVLYKNYLARMDKVADFLRVVDSVGLDKSEMPDLTRSPASILRLLEQHLAQLEAKKKGGAVSPAGGDEAEGEGGAANGDERETDDKENKTPNLRGDTSEAIGRGLAESADRKSPSAVAAAPPGPSGDAVKPAVAPPAPPPPPKPARPSPKSSPKVSPPAQKPDPKPEATPSATVAAAPEKKGPPERPAKPPSRPPPPSSSANPGQSSSTTETTQAADADQTSSAAKTETAPPAVAHSPPPPHPPPPSSEHLHHHQTPTEATSAAPAQDASVPAPTSQHLDNVASDSAAAAGVTGRDEPTGERGGADATLSSVQETSSAPSNGQSNHDEPPSVSCASASANVLSQTSAVLNAGAEVEVINHMSNLSNGEQAAETNHVNGANAVQGGHQVVVDEIEMPPPPPPIEDMDEPPAVEQQPLEGAEGEANAVASMQAVGAAQEPVVNGDER